MPPVLTKILRVLVMAGVLHGIAHAQVPTADAVLQRFVTALGGQKNLENIHTMVFRGDMEFPDLKLSGSTVEYFKYPDYFAVVTEVPGHGVTKVVYDGREAWILDSRNRMTQIAGGDLADMRRRAHIHWNLKLREFYPNIKVVGREAVNGGDAWKLEASMEEATYDLFFSVETGLLVRFSTDKRVTNGKSTVVITDYRKIDKVLFAFGAVMTEGPLKWNRKLLEVTFNQPIDDTVFRKPENAGAQ